MSNSKLEHVQSKMVKSNFSMKLFLFSKFEKLSYFDMCVTPVSGFHLSQMLIPESHKSLQIISKFGLHVQYTKI